MAEAVAADRANQGVLLCEHDCSRVLQLLDFVDDMTTLLWVLMFTVRRLAACVSVVLS